MKKVFWDDPYLCSLNTTVISVNSDRLLLAETIAFSFSGGQESDKAYINHFPVLHSELVDKLIYYTLPSNHGLAPGDQVIMQIDWPRRYRLMRLHFAAELILELVQRMRPIEKIGAHIAENKARIDFRFTHPISEIFPQLLKEYNEIIEKDLPILTGYSSVAEQRRYWEIAGFAKVPCGGTHVKSTAEVGFISLKRANIGGGKERIEIKLMNA